MPIHRSFVAAALATSLAGCATLGEAQCQQGDWFGIGASDARSGYTADRLAAHEAACARYAVTPDADGYYAGYGRGLQDFCVPAEAFALGRRGASYYRQCPAEIERDFIPAFDLGTDVYAVEQALLRLDIEIEELRKEIRSDKTSPLGREQAEQRLGYVKEERRRRDYDRSALLDRARQRGYGSYW